MIKRTQDVNNKKNTRGSDGKRSTLFPVATRRRKVRLSDISRYRHLQQQSKQGKADIDIYSNNLTRKMNTKEVHELLTK